MEEREGKNEPIKHGHITPGRGGPVGLTGAESPLWPWDPRPPSRRGPSGLAATHLSRALPRFFSCNLGIRTPISNPFLDYKP